MLAARIADEGRVVSEANDRSDHDRQSRRHAFGKRAGEEVIGVERKMMAMLLGGGPDRHRHDRIGVEAGLGFRPGQGLEPRSRHSIGSFGFHERHSMCDGLASRTMRPGRRERDPDAAGVLRADQQQIAALLGRQAALAQGFPARHDVGHL